MLVMYHEWGRGKGNTSGQLTMPTFAVKSPAIEVEFQMNCSQDNPNLYHEVWISFPTFKEQQPNLGGLSDTILRRPPKRLKRGRRDAPDYQPKIEGPTKTVPPFDLIFIIFRLTPMKYSSSDSRPLHRTPEAGPWEKDNRVFAPVAYLWSIPYVGRMPVMPHSCGARDKLCSV